MKIHLYVADGAYEKICKDGAAGLSSWDITVRLQKDDQSDEYFAEKWVPANSTKIGEFIPTFPGRDQCLGSALTFIDDRIRKVRADAEQEVRELQQRKNDLLMLTWDPKEN